MDFVKKCKRVLGTNKRLYDSEESSGSGRSYGKLSENKQKTNNKKPSNGCLCVYVGSERQRFVIKIKTFNHPLFKTFLEDVENEYGYTNDGPLWFPCDVNLFCEALVEIENAMDHKHNSVSHSSLSCRSNYNLSSVANYEILL